TYTPTRYVVPMINYFSEQPRLTQKLLATDVPLCPNRSFCHAQLPRETWTDAVHGFQEANRVFVQDRSHFPPENQFCHQSRSRGDTSPYIWMAIRKRQLVRVPEGDLRLRWEKRKRQTDAFHRRALFATGDPKS